MDYENLPDHKRTQSEKQLQLQISKVNKKPVATPRQNQFDPKDFSCLQVNLVLKQKSDMQNPNEAQSIETTRKCFTINKTNDGTGNYIKTTLIKQRPVLAMASFQRKEANNKLENISETGTIVKGIKTTLNSFNNVETSNILQIGAPYASFQMKNTSMKVKKFNSLKQTAPRTFSAAAENPSRTLRSTDDSALYSLESNTSREEEQNYYSPVSAKPAVEKVEATEKRENTYEEPQRVIHYGLPAPPSPTNTTNCPSFSKTFSGVQSKSYLADVSPFELFPPSKSASVSPTDQSNIFSKMDKPFTAKAKRLLTKKTSVSSLASNSSIYSKELPMVYLKRLASFDEQNNQVLQESDSTYDLARRFSIDENVYEEAAIVDQRKTDESDEEYPSYYQLLVVKNQCKDDFSFSLPRTICKRKQSKGSKDINLIQLERSTVHPPAFLSDSNEGDLDSLNRDSLDTEDLYLKRRYVLENIGISEKNYVGVLRVISQYKSSFNSYLASSLPLSSTYLTAEEVDLLFSDTGKLLKCHENFVKSYEQFEDQLKLKCDVHAGEVIYELAKSELSIGKRFITSYPSIVNIIQRITKNESKYKELTKNVCITNLADTKLEELFFKPIFQLQKNISMWFDLLGVTPDEHPDYPILVSIQKSSEQFLSNINSKPSRMCQDKLLKQGVLVEKGIRRRKLVNLFLFKEVIACAKEKVTNGINISHDLKWDIPLCSLEIAQQESDVFECKESDVDRENDLNELQKDLIKLQSEMQAELKQNSSNDHLSLIVQPGTNRKIDALQKKIEKQEILLSLSLPFLPLILIDTRTGKERHLLLSSHYDLASWIEVITKAIKNAPSTYKLTTTDVTKMINSNKFAVPKMSYLVDKTESQDYLSKGNLNVIIHRLTGLKQKLNVACTVETDFFGHFSIKGKTTAVESLEPEWNEGVDIDMEGVKTLRILAYKTGKGDVLLGKCTLELDRVWLSDKTKFETFMLNNELQLSLTLKFSPLQKMSRRLTYVNPGGMFGISISKLSKREDSLVPGLVRWCVREIENRGLTELGLYRVSGLMSEILKVRNAFDTGNSEQAQALLRKSDISVLTSVLKLFLRELPEALFTDSRYENFISALENEDEFLRTKQLIELFADLPQCNSFTALFILQHIIKVSQFCDSNKMTLENLSTIFGPTLLRPAITEGLGLTNQQKIAEETGSINKQANILLFYLKHIDLLLQMNYNKQNNDNNQKNF